MTGMRIGEAAALLWSDIDFDTGLLSITKTMYYKSMDDFKPVEPKTQASVRTIYIDKDDHSAKTIRYELAQRVRYQLRKTPELTFHIDDSLDYIDKIDSLLGADRQEAE